MDSGFLEEGDVGTAQFGNAATIGPAHAPNLAGENIFYYNNKSSKVTRNISSSHKVSKTFMLLL